MTTPFRTSATIVLVTAVSIGALVAIMFTFRGRLADTPIVGAVVDRLGWRTEMDPPDTLSRMADPMPAVTEPAAVGSPRAEVYIDPRRQQLIGVRTAPAERRTLTKQIRAVGTVRYDETRLADVNVKVAGWIEELYVDYTGQLIEVGQPLFMIYSPELLTTQQEYLLALESRAQLRESQIADVRVYADRLVDAARQRLVLWDLPPDEIQSLEDRGETQRTMLFRAPVGGFVIEKRVVQGQHVLPGMSLYTVADLSAVWVEADVYEEDVPLVREGAWATVTMDAYPGEVFRGQVTYIYPYVEERTRTVRVRFAFPNPRGRLKPGMYANVALDATFGEGVVVPTNAVLDSGDQQHVFVSQGDGYFEPRPVVIGRRLGETIQILEGLEGGELVATSATFFIDSESQLRAALQGFEPVPRAGEGAAARERLDITFRSQPDPPQSGDNAFEVAVLDPEGQPLTDAEVTVVFYMAPMPTMNMPAMQTDVSLTHQGSGIYRGEGEVTMAGRWDVTVLVSRGGQRLDSRTLTVVAR
ncbi:MAG: FixH family protein [Vicinamibacterales bacterium]